MGVCVAAEDDQIARVVLKFGGQVAVTGPGYASGTDRVAAVAGQSRFAGIDVVVNLQGDEPELPAAAIDQVVQLLEEQSHAVMATLATPIRSAAQLEDPACVKVVCNQHREAIYFSRAAIPYVGQETADWLTREPPVFYQHIGLYAYRRDFLLQLTRMPPARLEQLESLEQLRVLEAGYRIAVAVIPHAGCGIDTERDYRQFVRRQLSA